MPKSFEVCQRPGFLNQGQCPPHVGANFHPHFIFPFLDIFEIDREEITFGRQLGSGQFGVISYTSFSIVTV